jgi:hypothetical protein
VLGVGVALEVGVGIGVGLGVAVAVAVGGMGASVVGCGPPRDAVEKTTDVHVTPQHEDYVHVARRARGSVALAEARALPQADAVRWVERWADLLDACAADLEGAGKLDDGAARVVVVLDPAGQIAGTNVKTSEGPAAAATTLQCLLVPIRSTPFPSGSADGGSRGVAIEATWHKAKPTSTSTPTGTTAATDGGAG